MKVGDFVRLKNPFRPEPDEGQEYSFGVVVKLMHNDSGSTDSCGSIALIIHLCDAENFAIYQDELGARVMFYFHQNEVGHFQIDFGDRGKKLG